MKPVAVNPVVISPPTAPNILDLSKKPANSLAALKGAIKNMAPNVTCLLLNNSHLDTYSGRQLVELFQSIPAHVIHLDLRWNLLGIMAPPELKKALKAIPPTIVELLLGGNMLNELGDELSAIFRDALHNQFRLLDLSFNGLGTLAYPLLLPLFRSFPNSLTTLNLDGNSLNLSVFPPLTAHNKLLDKMLVNLLDVLPQGLTNLNLANNVVNVTSDVALFTRSIRRSVTHLDLSGTTLSGFTPQQLALGFAELPQNLDTLNLGFGKLPRLGRAPAATTATPAATAAAPAATAAAPAATAPAARAAAVPAELLGPFTHAQWTIMLHQMPSSVSRVMYEYTHSLADFLPNTPQIRRYAIEVLFSTLLTFPHEIINLIMTYPIDPPIIWPSFYTVAPAPSAPTLEVLDDQGQATASLAAPPNAPTKKPAQVSPTFVATLNSYRGTLFATATGSEMALEQSLLGAQLT